MEKRDLAKELYLLSLLSKIVRQWHPSQIQELAYGLRNGLTQEQILKYADTNFGASVMETLRRCYNLLDDDQIDELLESIKRVGFSSATEEVFNREIQKKVKDFDPKKYDYIRLRELHDWLLYGFDFSKLDGLLHPKYPLDVLIQVLEDVLDTEIDREIVKKYLHVYRQTRDVNIMDRQRSFYIDGYYPDYEGWNFDYYGEYSDEFEYDEYYEDINHFKESYKDTCLD